jgi:hypothetical protein
MKLQMAKAEASLRDDPKPMDRATWQRIKVVVEHEVLHRDWGCALYRLHRTGRIDNDQREAGDKYSILIRDFRKLWSDPISRIQVYDKHKDDHGNPIEVTKLVRFGLGHVVADAMELESEFETKRAKRIGSRYKEAAGVAGIARRALEDLLVDDVWPVGERGHQSVAHALTRLSHFFNTGTKRKR